MTFGPDCGKVTGVALRWRRWPCIPAQPMGTGRTFGGGGVRLFPTLRGGGEGRFSAFLGLPLKVCPYKGDEPSTLCETVWQFTVRFGGTRKRGSGFFEGVHPQTVYGSCVCGFCLDMSRTGAPVFQRAYLGHQEPRIWCGWPPEPQAQWPLYIRAL